MSLRPKAYILTFPTLAAELCLAAANPWLLYKIHKDGPPGVSVETQILRLIMIVTRYLDLFWYGEVISPYNTIMKVLLAVTSVHVVSSLVIQHRAHTLADFKHAPYHLGLPIIFAACLSAPFAYIPTFLDYAWAFSQFLGVVAHIPQLLLFVRPENRDWKMKVYIGMLAGYRVLSIPYWVLRYLAWGFVDPITIGAGVSEVVIFGVAVGGILLSNYNLRSQSQDLEDMSVKTCIIEDPVAEYPRDLKVLPEL